MYHPDTTKGVLPTDARWAEAFRRRLSELRAKARGDLHAALAQAQRRADDAEAYAESLEAWVGELEREIDLLRMESPTERQPEKAPGCACLDVARGHITGVSWSFKAGEKPVIWLGKGSQYRGR